MPKKPKIAVVQTPECSQTVQMIGSVF